MSVFQASCGATVTSLAACPRVTCASPRPAIATLHCTCKGTPPAPPTGVWTACPWNSAASVMGLGVRHRRQAGKEEQEEVEEGAGELGKRRGGREAREGVGRRVCRGSPCSCAVSRTCVTTWRIWTSATWPRSPGPTAACTEVRALSVCLCLRL